MKPEFKNIKLNLSSKNISQKEWEEKFKQETGKSVEDFIWETMEKIPVKPLYTKDDIDNIDTLITCQEFLLFYGDLIRQCMFSVLGL